MKKLSSLLAVLFLTTVSVFAGDWQTDYKAALAQAAQEKKMVLLDFTGSDWCPWCIALDKDVFAQPAFKTYADKNLVLVTLDYPQSTPQAPELKAQNEKLATQYKVAGFPTLVLLNSNGKQINIHQGYLPGGPAAFEAWVKSSKK